MTLKIVLFNGPPRSGKDTAADFIRDTLGLYRCAFAEPLKTAVIQSLGLNDWRDYEGRKDTELDEFFGYTPRQAYIDFSENYMKDRYGHDIFAEIFYRKIKELQSPKEYGTVISDCGFQNEVDWLHAKFDVRVALIHIIRPGHDFNGDSRGYVQPRDGMYFGVINNDQDLIWLQEQALDQVNLFLLASK